MTAEQLALYAGVVLSLAFSYVPKLSDWFAKLEATTKRLAMAGLLLVVAGAVVGLACSGFGADLGLTVSCDRAGIVGVINAFILALIANQATYALSPQK